MGRRVSVTDGEAFNFAVTRTSAGLAEYADSGCYAYVNQRAAYGTLPPWGSPHPTGLPPRVGDPARPLARTTAVGQASPDGSSAP